MAGPVDACIFCETVHKGSCGGPAPKPPKKRTPKTPPTQGKTTEVSQATGPTEGGHTSSGPGSGDESTWFEDDTKPKWESKADEHAAALAALAPILHPSEIEKHGLRPNGKPLLVMRVRQWREGRRGKA